jgi:Na+-driven multidrug efflux pump
MSKQTKSIIYNFLGFAVFFLPFYYLIKYFTGLTGFWIPITSFVVSTILAPKFQAVKTREGEKLFMKWIFSKEVKELK